MVEIISVSPQANVEAVRRQLARGRTDRVALLLPDGWTELDNAARMRLVQRQAQIQHRELSVITRHEGTRKVAQQLGIPVFVQPNDVQRGRWRMSPDLPLIDPQRPDAGLPERPPWRRGDILARSARPSHHQARLQRIRAGERRRRGLPFWLRLLGYGAMGSVVGLVLLLFVRFVLPAATVTITPGVEPINVTVSLTADGNLDVVDPEANVLPARFIETTIEQTGTIATTGTTQKANARAQGQVVFSNLGSTPVNIPTGTVVSTSTGTQVSFRTTAPAELPGGVGQRVTVPVEALEEGINGNVRANTINTVSGALRFRVRVINTGATYGGDAQLVKIVTQADKDNLLAQVQESIEAQAYATLSEQLEPGEWLPPESIQTFVVSQVFDKFNDDEGDELSLTLRMLVQGTALNQSQTNEAMLAALRQAVPPRGMLVADSVATQREPGAVALGRQVQFTMTASADYVIPVDPDEVKAMIAGEPPDAAMAAIAARWNVARPPELYRDPEWLATLPTFPSRIQVRIEYSGSLSDAVGAESVGSSAGAP